MSTPVLNENTFSQNAQYVTADSIPMTVDGTILKTVLLMAILILAGAFSWNAYATGQMLMAQGLMFGGLIVGFILAIIISFKPTAAPFLSPIYAACEGLALGAISSMFEASYSGIVLQAIALSLAAMMAMLFLYMSRIIKVDNKFRASVMIATFAILIVYLASWILSFFGKSVPYIHESGMIGIGFSLLVVGVASFNFLLDFDIIERGVQSYAPKYMEWYGGFALLVTLVWLYIEMLKLLSKFASRRN
ncbi:MAG: Bax inhibitor-1/YccA family protein [Candidatus Gastranaerophilales bacterium]|nr:Bax inhibitor-1/YccA family protein [Candidatus Gastranaerophilales bacterium]